MNYLFRKADHALLMQLEYQRGYRYVHAASMIYIVCKYLLVWPYIEVLFSKNSFLTPERSIGPIVTELLGTTPQFWVGVLLISCIASAFVPSRTLAIVIYAIHELLITGSGYYSNGGDNWMRLLLFYFVIAPPVGSSNGGRLLALTILTAKCHFCLIFLVSACGKLNSDYWYSGVATYYVLVSERFMAFTWIKQAVQNAWFVNLTTYYTLAVELALPFLLWSSNRISRLVIVLAAITLHLGIAIFMSLWAFQFLFICCYLLFFQNGELDAATRRFEELRRRMWRWSAAWWGAGRLGDSSSSL